MIATASLFRCRRARSPPLLTASSRSRLGNPARLWSGLLVRSNCQNCQKGLLAASSASTSRAADMQLRARFGQVGDQHAAIRG